PDRIQSLSAAFQLPLRIRRSFRRQARPGNSIKSTGGKMNTNTLGLCRNAILAFAAAALLSPAIAGADDYDDWWVADPIEGVWNARVTITNCADGTPLPVSFDALGMFGRGGTFNNTDAQNPVTPTIRSSVFGTWK